MADLSRFDLSGRKALVTGASRGIGRRLAVGLAQAGADIAVAARSAHALADTVRDIQALGRHAVAVELDVREVAQCRLAAEQAAATLGDLNILVNNAGVEEVRPSLEVDEALWDKILDTNLKGAFFCAQAAAGLMKESGRGAIVNLCSLTSEIGIPTATPYGSSKTGLLGMTRALAVEWAPLGIRVNAIAPGYFRTSMTEGFYADPSWRETMLAKIPAGRFGDLDDLVGITVFLCSDASAYVTGQCMAVDGGFLASV